MEKKQRKPTKTISGVAPLAVMLSPRKCEHGACLFCPSLDVPQSYTPESPAVMRAKKLNYDVKKQVEVRLDAFKAMNHPVDKIEMIIMGGTFLQYSDDFQERFVKDIYDALNGKESESLEKAKKINETAEHRCVAMCVETRPDWCSDEDIEKMLRWGVTRVEIGVQVVDDEVYEKVNRGHNVKEVVDATKRLKEAGFKIGYHLMPGLPGMDLERDKEKFLEIFSNEDFKPDQIKIYPCQVLKGSDLEKWYYEGKYKPYEKEEIQNLIIYFLENTSRYCRAMRIMREIPPTFMVAGTKRIDLRKDIEQEIRKRDLDVKEIRFREIGFALRDGREVDENVEIKVLEYGASGGKEYFLEAVNKDDILFGLLRLRLDENARVRELHVYGPTLKLKEKDAEKWQHKGLGKKLMKKAEEIAKENGFDKISVISGIGVRKYYEKLGYVLDEKGIYVEKGL